MRSGSRSRLAIFIESSTRTGLKYSIPVLALAAAYLLYIILGPRLHMVAKMTATDKQYMQYTVLFAQTVLRYAAIVLVASLALRYFYEPLVGQILTVAGGVLYFFSPAIVSYFTLGELVRDLTYQGIVAEFSRMGLAALVPGAVLLGRDMFQRLRARFMETIAAARQWGDEEDRRKKHQRRKLYEHCWDMPFCRDFVKKVCPAWQKRKSCWRVKCGCYCDEHTILKAMTNDAMDNQYARGFMKTLTDSGSSQQNVTAAQKRARCRRCIVYAEHQRQKYRILSPLMFPAVALLFYVNYGRLVELSKIVFVGTDRFVSFLTLRPHQWISGGEQQVFTTLAIVWLWIVVLSYALQGLEYLIFDLQV